MAVRRVLSPVPNFQKLGWSKTGLVHYLKRWEWVEIFRRFWLLFRCSIAKNSKIGMELRENGKTEKIEIIPKNRFFGGWHFRPLKTRRKNKSWIFFNSDRVNSISMLQSAPKLLSNLIRYSFQWQRNDFTYSSWNIVMFDKNAIYWVFRSSGIRTEKTTMVFRKLGNSKDDHYRILVW